MDRGAAVTERTKPLAFLLEGLTLHVDEGDGKETVWAAELRWDDEDGCFVLDGNMPGNYDFAPCDLEELARIMRTLNRALEKP